MHTKFFIICIFKLLFGEVCLNLSVVYIGVYACILMYVCINTLYVAPFGYFVKKCCGYRHVGLRQFGDVLQAVESTIISFQTKCAADQIYVLLHPVCPYTVQKLKRM